MGLSSPNNKFGILLGGAGVMKLFALSVLASLFLFTVNPAQVRAGETWRLTSLDWPPFSGEELPEQGAAVSLLREALKTQGIDLAVDFYPWSRAIMEAAKNKDYVGYFPAWPAEVQLGFFPSSPMFSSPVSMMFPTNKPIEWIQEEDLFDHNLVFVQDYGYSRTLMKAVQKNLLTPQFVTTDLGQMKMVLSGRAEGGPIDDNVFAYLMRTHSELKGAQGQLALSPNRIGSNPLVVAIGDTADNKFLAITLNAALQNIRGQEFIEQYMKRHGFFNGN